MNVRSTFGVLILALVCHMATGETTIYQPNNSVSSAQSLSEQIAWPMLPGENLKSLSARFFPDDEHLQQVFVDKAIKLNAKTIPNLNAEVLFTSPKAILIPKPKMVRLGIHPIKPAVAETPTLQYSYGLDSSSVEGPGQKVHSVLPTTDADAAQYWIKQNLWVPVQAFCSDLSIENAKEKLFGNPAGTGGLSLFYQKISAYLGEQDPLRLLLWIFAISALLLGVYLPIRAKRIAARKPKFAAERKEPLLFTASGHMESASTDETLLEEETDAQTKGRADRLILKEAKNLVEKKKIDEAIAHMQRAIRAKSHTSIVIWLYMLDLLKRAKRRNAFEQYAAELHKKFNVVAPPWRKTSRNRSLESHKHIEKRITAQWPMTDKLRPYLQKLIDDNRSGFRDGFSVTEIEEILLLIDVLDAHNEADKAKL